MKYLKILVFAKVLSFSGLLLCQVPEGEIALSASSTLAPGRTSNYTPDNINDGTIASWCEGAEGDGIGEYLQVDFRYPDLMEFITFKNGFGKEEYWSANGRVKTLKISNEEGDSRILEVKDTPDLQVLGLWEFREEEGVRFPAGALNGNNFTFEIMEVYPGERWQDICITEMKFNQWHTEDFPMKEEYIYKNLYRIFFEGIVGVDGQLYTESDWDGFVETSFDNGYIYNEIVSGDDTQGYDEYQVFINGLTNEYYLFHSSYVSYISQAGMEGKVDENGKPERIEKTNWEFFLYYPEENEFSLVDSAGLAELFIVSPMGLFTDEDGNALGNQDISINCIAPKTIAVSYPPLSEDQVFYDWDGNWFRQW